MSASTPVTTMRGWAATLRACAMRAASGGRSAVLQRIAGRHQPPDRVEPQAFQRD
jgi:hypothetical protein